MILNIEYMNDKDIKKEHEKVKDEKTFWVHYASYKNFYQYYGYRVIEYDKKTKSAKITNE